MYTAKLLGRHSLRLQGTRVEQRGTVEPEADAKFHCDRDRYKTVPRSVHYIPKTTLYHFVNYTSTKHKTKSVLYTIMKSL
jgi:hypothetical protein